MILYILRTIEFADENEGSPQKTNNKNEGKIVYQRKKYGKDFVAPNDMPSMVGKTRPLNIGRGGISGGIGLYPPKRSLSIKEESGQTLQNSTEEQKVMKQIQK